jgi:hypothetical protein
MRGSMGKRSGTPAAEYLRWSEREATSPYSPPAGERSFDFPTPLAQDDEEGGLDFELNDENLSDGYDGLENVRACCDGRHTVGHHHHHHHHHPHGSSEVDVTQPQPQRAPSRNGGRLLSAQNVPQSVEPAVRPNSPSGWSIRSRSGSTARSLFSRFGSVRSTKTAVNDR